MNTRIKVCGITRVRDAVAAVESGVHAIGMIFAKSQRKVDVSTAKEIIRNLPPLVFVVGVFVNPSVKEIGCILEACELNPVQLHGDESPDFCEDIQKRFGIPVIKAFRIKDKDSLSSIYKFDVYAYLVDTYSKCSYGGTGKSFDWALLENISKNRLILSGGLNSKNVFKAIKFVKPSVVDVSSGVEIVPGIKDIKKIREFVAEVRKADSNRQ